jgi:hypothetical protein
MAAKTRYSPSYEGVRALMNSPSMLAMLLRAADRGKAFAVSISPRKTGHYSESFETSVAPNGGARGNRGEAILRNTAAYAIDVEYHNNTRVLGKTVDYIEGS